MADKSPKQDAIPPLEWAAAVAGLMIALFMLGTILSYGLSGSDDPVPLLGVTALAVTPSAQNHVVTVRVVNTSSRTAAAVQVEGVLKRGGEDLETSIATVDYVAGHSEASAALVFRENPRAHELDLRVTGYEHP